MDTAIWMVRQNEARKIEPQVVEWRRLLMNLLRQTAPVEICRSWTIPMIIPAADEVGFVPLFVCLTIMCVVMDLKL